MARKIPTLAELVAARRTAAGFASIRAAVEASKSNKGAAVPLGSWAEIENGTNANPKLSTVLAIAATLKCKPSELLEQTGDAHAVREVPVACVFPNPNNVRRTKPSDEEVGRIADSIRQFGLLQPITVRPAPPDPHISGECFEIVFGETRWRGVIRALGTKATIKVQVRDDISDADMALLMLAENMQRVGMADIDVADALYAATREGKRWDDLVATTGRSRRWCQEMVQIGRDLCDDARGYLQAGRIKSSHAVILAGIKDKGLQATLAVEATKLTEDQLRERVQALRNPPAKPTLPLALPKHEPPSPASDKDSPRSDAPPPAPPPQREPEARTPVQAAAPLPGAREARQLGRVAPVSATVTPVAPSLEWDTTGTLAEGSFHVVILGAGLIVKACEHAASWKVLCALIEQHFPDANFIHSELGWSKNALDAPILGAFGNVIIMRTDGVE